MHSTTKTQTEAAKKVDAAIEALARELQGFVLDTAKLIAPMVKDGRLKGRAAIAGKILSCYHSNTLVLTLDSRNPWLVHAIACTMFPRREMLMHEAWLGEVCNDEAIDAYESGKPEVPENETPALETARRAAQALLVWSIFEAMREQGVETLS
jgi:hypothetical protein